MMGALIKCPMKNGTIYVVPIWNSVAAGAPVDFRMKNGTVIKTAGGTVGAG